MSSLNNKLKQINKDNNSNSISNFEKNFIYSKMVLEQK